MDMNQLAKLFSELCMMFALLGLILYLPLKPHWSKIFSFWDGLLLYCGIGAPILYIYLFSLDFEIGIGAILTGIIVGGGFAIAGLVTLIKCWTRCGNLLEAIFLPFIMLMMVGVFCLGLLCLLLALVGIFQRPYLTWDSFE
ncbi:MAG: hypothetical protein ACI4TF_06115 [Oliverpabstia sp.]